MRRRAPRAATAAPASGASTPHADVAAAATPQATTASAAALGTRHPGNADPRTKLALVIVLNAVALTPGPDPIGWTIWALCAAVLAWFRRWRMLAVLACAYLGLQVLAALLVPLGHPAATTIAVGLLVAARYMLPVGLAMALYASTRGSELIAGLRALRVPEALVVPLAVTYRFIPTVGAEAQAIVAALRLRGGSRLGPLTALEYVFAPLITTVLRIGEELTAASLTRGLGARTGADGQPIRPTSIAQIGFRWVDGLWIVCALMPIAMLFGSAWLPL